MSKKQEKAQKYNRLKEVLDSSNKSAYWLAKELDMGYSQVHGYVQNKTQPSLETLYKLAKALKVDPCDLLM